MELKIDPELKAYLGPVSKFAEEELERQLVACNGPTDPIYAWQGKGIIVDGMRRYTICRKHSLPFSVKTIEFKDKDAVKEWMDRRQFCRRNTQAKAEATHVARLVRESDAKTRTQAVSQVAQKTGKTTRQVWRDVKKEDEKERLLSGVLPDLRTQIENGQIKLNYKALTALSELPEDLQTEVQATVDSGEYETLQEALLGKKKPPKQVDSGPSTANDMSVPAPKPRADYFQDLMRQVGVLKKTLGDTHKYFPCGQYAQLKRYADLLGQGIVDWREHA